MNQYEVLVPEVAPTSLDGLSKELRVYCDDLLEIWYSPHGQASPKPKLWILGITPGWNQMRIAYEDAAKAIGQGLSPSEAARAKKPRVAFAGSMRNNLITMMDAIGIAKIFEVNTSRDLFGTELIRTGSVLKYPVFKNGKNYTGYAPAPMKHPALCEMLDTVFAKELANIEDCLILPLGKTVESVLDYSISKGWLEPSRILRGFPHPSGANGHRKTIFHQNKAALKGMVTTWFDSSAK